MKISLLERKTKETDIRIELNPDSRDITLETGIGFFDHMLHALLFYSGLGGQINVEGDLYVDAHHTVEDTGLALGAAIKQGLGDKMGIKRFASSIVPMDEALCRTVLDISGRPFFVFDAQMPQSMIGQYDACLTEEFMRAFAYAGGITLHQKCLYGSNAHHITEALFKSLGLALREGMEIRGDGVTSTKGVLD